MAVGNLEFIKNVQGADNITSLDIDNVFSDKYDVYFVTHLTGQSSVGYISMSLLDSSGSEVTTTTYDKAHLSMPANLSYSEYRLVNNNKWARVNYTFNNAIGGTTSYYIFNPYNSSSYTFMTFQNGFESVGTMYGLKGIGVERTAATRRGFRISASSNFSGADISVYGLASN
jgi:hypothetical protein